MLNLSIAVTVLLSSLVIMIAFTLGLKTNYDLEKLSPFECGFISQTKSRSPFSMHFFLISIIFLIFDIELILLFPFLLTSENSPSSMNIFFMVVILLTWGTLIEWSETMLDWTNF